MYQLCPNIPTPSTSKLKRDHITYQCKGSVGGGGGQGGRAWCGDVTFFQNLLSNSLPTGKSFQSNAQNFLELISFIRVATVREKSGKNKNFSRSGKSQGIF